VGSEQYVLAVLQLYDKAVKDYRYFKVCKRYMKFLLK
jgi:hypothetical protein